MQRMILVLLMIVASHFTNVAHAATATDKFATCLVESLNGKERKGLATWIFMSIAAHPEISPFGNVTQADRQRSDEFVGALITRLLVDDCPTQLNAANAANHMAIEKAFELVGQVAMQELMTNQDVMVALTNYARFADMEKIRDQLN